MLEDISTPSVLVHVPLCDYERWGSLHALTALGAINATGFSLEVFVHVQTQQLYWSELESLKEDYPFPLVTEYWWDEMIPVGNGQHDDTIRLHGITYSRNRALTRARNEHFAGLWFVDSDVLVPRDALLRLWNLGKPLSSGVFFAQPSGVPYVFAKDLGRAMDGPADEDYGGHFLRWLPREGFLDVDFTGNGCLLWGGLALESDLSYGFGWREQEAVFWGEDPYTLLEALDLGIGPVRVDCGLRCFHTMHDGYAYTDTKKILTETLLTEARKQWPLQR